MRKAYILLVLGIWIAILSYLGFPYSWKNVLFTLSGIAIIYASFVIYKESKTKPNKEEIFDNFSENKSFNEEKIETTL